MRGKGSTIVTIAFSLILVLAVLSPVCHSASDVEGEIMGIPAGWSDEIPLSDYNVTNKYCSIATNGDEIYVIWRHNYTDLVFSKSIDGGKTWSPFNSIYYNGLGTVLYNDIAVSGQNIHVVVGDFDGWDGMYYRNSTDGGETWNSVKRISSDGVNALGPKILVNDSNVHIIWLDERDGQHREVYYRRSLDGGVTFDNGQGVDEDRRLTFSPSYVSGIAIGGYGTNISFTWCDERDGDWEKYWMISKDNGFSWEDGLGNPSIGRKLTDDTSESSSGAVGANGSNVHVIWMDEEWPGPVYRLYYRNSTDNGLTWNSQLLLSGPSVGIVRPDIDVVGNNIHVVWDDEKHDGVHEEIYYKNSTDGGITWSTDLRLTYNLSREARWPRVSVANNIVHITWWDKIQNINHQVMYKRYPDFPPDPEYNITLQEGWNLISLPLEQRDESIDQVLQSIDGKWDCIQTYVPLSPELWKTNNTFRPDQLNDFSTLNHKIGFWINITESNVNLTVRGHIPTSTSIPLYAGWNLVGYPTMSTEIVANALWGTGADKVEVFDPGEPYRIKEVGPTYEMKPGEGYWVHVVADSVWTIDW